MNVKCGDGGSLRRHRVFYIFVLDFMFRRWCVRAEGAFLMAPKKVAVCPLYYFFRFIQLAE